MELDGMGRTAVSPLGGAVVGSLWAALPGTPRLLHDSFRGAPPSRLPGWSGHTTSGWYPAGARGGMAAAQRPPAGGAPQRGVPHPQGWQGAWEPRGESPR